MTTTIYADGSTDEYGCEVAVGWRASVGNRRLAFIWKVSAGEMERFMTFHDIYGREYNRRGLMEFVAECDEVHEFGCHCPRSGPVEAMPERALHRWYP